MHHDMPKPEEWRPIPSHPDYEVSSYGRIISNKLGRSRLMKPHIHPLGYARITVDGSQQSMHRLVAEAFIGPCPEDKEVDHINRVRDDNRPENLRYLTRQENMARMVPKPFTECINGHSMTGDNVYVRPSSGRHECRACARQRHDRRVFVEPCSAVEGCDRYATCGLTTDRPVCEMHYQRARKDEKKARLAQGSDTAANEAC